MSGYSIIYTPEAEAQLLALYHYLAIEASPATAARFTDAIVERCEALCDFPERGAPRVQRATRSAYASVPAGDHHLCRADRQLVIVGIFFGGQDHESILRQD